MAADHHSYVTICSPRLHDEVPEVTGIHMITKPLDFERWRESSHVTRLILFLRLHKRHNWTRTLNINEEKRRRSKEEKRVIIIIIFSALFSLSLLVEREKLTLEEPKRPIISFPSIIIKFQTLLPHINPTISSRCKARAVLVPLPLQWPPQTSPTSFCLCRCSLRRRAAPFQLTSTIRSPHWISSSCSQAAGYVSEFCRSPMALPPKFSYLTSPFIL